MYVLLINGSPHTYGTTDGALKIIRGELEAAGVRTEQFDIGANPIQGCKACMMCRKYRGRCAFGAEDGVNDCLEKMKDADGLIISSPTYFGGIAGGMKCFLDRMFYSRDFARGKVGAAIVAARRSGGEDAFHQLQSYLTLAGFVIPPSIYWNYIHGNSAEESKEDLEGLDICATIGRETAWLVKVLAETNVPRPEDVERRWTNFVR